MRPSTPSAMRASRAAGMAPAKTSELSTEATPRKISSPRPPAPMAAAMVATPTQVTIAVRRPARMTLADMGSSSLVRRWRSVMPRALATWMESGVDRADAGVGVAQDGEECVAGEGDDGEAGGAVAEEWDGKQEAEEGQAEAL